MRIDLTVDGDVALRRKLARLIDLAPKPVTRKALRASAKRIHRRLIRKVSGYPVRVITGEYLKAVEAAKPRAGRRSRGSMQMTIPQPTEPEQAIQQNALEYGRTRGRGAPAPAFPHVRPAVDEKKRSELLLIGRDIGRGIVREAKKK